jgi:phosphatidylglycerol:prolipoprotein diacylglycerol transferase
MLPHFSSTTIPLWPVVIQTWGSFVALGFLVGAIAGAWMCKRRGLKSIVVWDALGWIILSSMIFARVFFVIFYAPSYFWSHPVEIFYLWQGGMSMMGGLFGAVAAGLIYFCWKKIDWWQYVDAMIFGLPLGYAIGRIGCFLIHDHPGWPTDFFLGVQYSDGIIRHDLGLYHSLFGWLLFIVFLILAEKKNRVGIFLEVFLITYGAFRFAADFLRVDDARWLLLTPAQWFGWLLITVGIVMITKNRNKGPI